MKLIMERLPLPGVLGRVCPHPCEDKCRRAEMDEPVAICSLKRFAADQVDLGSLTPPLVEARPEKIAIVGSGPAGLTCAYHLALQGLPAHHLRGPAQGRRHAPGGHPRLPAAQGRPGPGNRQHPAPGGGHSRPTPPWAGISPWTGSWTRATRRSSWASAAMWASPWGFPAKTPRAWSRGWSSCGRHNLGEPQEIGKTPGGHRRRQRGHRRGLHRPAPGLRGDHRLPPLPGRDARLCSTKSSRPCARA